MNDTHTRQLAMARRFGAEAITPLAGEKVGVSQSLRDGVFPIHGLRHPPAGATSGWYIWAGDFSDASDFFAPLHVEHLPGRCGAVIPYLGLPPGWRFLLAPGHEDVWFDASLLV